MRPTTLKDIARWCGGSVAPEYENVEITGLCHDSREAEPGTLFFALTGQHDGHDYIPAAKEKGAAAAICSREGSYGLPVVMVDDTRKALRDVAREYRGTMDCTTVAITGSVGKTTTRTMVAQLLAQSYCTSSTYKNYNNDIGLPVTIGKSAPDCEMLVLEMGMNHFGEMRVLSEIGQPDIVLITNIGSMHIENLGSRQGILKAKLEILEGLRPGGTIIFNGDEPMLWNLNNDGTLPEKPLFFGIENPHLDVRASEVRLESDRSSFRVTGFGQEFFVDIPVSGKHNVYNALAAITVALKCGVPPEKIQKGFLHFENTSQRQQIIHWNGYTIIDDTYNAGPESMEAALRVMGDIKTDGKHIAVLGDMLELGNHSSAAHYRIGRMAAYMADILLTYGPASEKMVQGAVTGGLSQRCAMQFASQEELLNVLKSKARKGDVLLFKGSHGMHMEQIMKDFMTE